MAQSQDVPFEVQVELLELIAEQEDFKKSAQAVQVIGPEDIRAILKGIAAFMRAAHKAGIYEAEKSTVLSDKVKSTLESLNETERQMLYDAFGLGGDEES